MYVCVEPVKEEIERGCRKVWLRKGGVGIQGRIQLFKEVSQNFNKAEAPKLASTNATNQENSM